MEGVVAARNRINMIQGIVPLVGMWTCLWNLNKTAEWIVIKLAASCEEEVPYGLVM